MKSTYGSLFAIALTVSACSPDDPEDITGVELGDDGASDGATPLLDPEPLGFGVVASDYTSTSITLLNRDGEVLKRDFINSGSAPAGLVTALSGDVVLPTRSGDPGILTIIDRFRTDVITRIDVASGEVLGQVKTHSPNAEDDETSYSSNPHDYIYLDEDTAWVTRFEPNAGADDDDPDLGIDLFQLDPTEFRRTGERIDLNRLNGTAERENPDTMATEEVTVYARPSRMVRLGDFVVVGIASLSLTFDAAGDGMVALIDLESGTAEGFELPGLQNCGTVAPVPDDGARVAVACSGFYGGVPRDSAGIAVLVLEDGELSIENVWRAKDDPDSALVMYGLVALSPTVVLASASGSAMAMPPTNDKYYRVDLESGEQREIFEAEGQYVIGDGSYSPRKNLLLVPDASRDEQNRPTAGVRRFEVSEELEVEAIDVIEIDDVLPPRQVMPL